MKKVHKCLCSVSPVKPQEWSEDTDKYLQIQTSEGGRVMAEKVESVDVWRGKYP